MIRKRKINGITLYFIQSMCDISKHNTFKLINNQSFLQDLIKFIKNWVANNPNYNKKI